jgi:hypothetical protein
MATDCRDHDTRIAIHRPQVVLVAAIAAIFLFTTGCSSGAAPTASGPSISASPAATAILSADPTLTPSAAPSSSAPSSSGPTVKPIAAPPPVIAGNYHGSFTGGILGNSTIDLSITQSGSVLSGTTDESGYLSTDSGTITSDGHLHIFQNGTGTLTGLVVAHGHLSGTWKSNGPSGTWDVTLVPTVEGNYSGSWTQSGFAGHFPMSIQISQVGGVLSGSTTESGSVYTDTGTIAANGSLHIVETHNSTVVDLYGSVVTAHELKGTWGPSGSSGTWDVTK